ncbi:MAG: TIGR03000 domain-containing protein [Gemmataceae bacterium]|nr:TIGR03000 domain-containing protein [Gemmataceae bacterium]MDW8242151.1 TIGR03000 domain-containing protein [Thermogemmata sp.]
MVTCLLLTQVGGAADNPSPLPAAPLVVPPVENDPPFQGTAASYSAGTLIRRKDWEAHLQPKRPIPAATDMPRWHITAAAGPPFGPGFYLSGWPYGPRVAPPWSYPGLPAGPYVGYPWGLPGYYPARFGSFWTNGLSLYGPPVPVYGPIPGVFGNEDLVRQWRAVPSPGFPFGWVGLFAASPRPKHPSVSVWSSLEPLGGEHPTAPVESPAAPSDPSVPADKALPPPRPVAAAAPIFLAVRVPQPAAEVWINGQRTQQTGTDRLFESPPLPANQLYEYQVLARWFYQGQWREQVCRVRGRPGELLRVDFTSLQGD